VSVISARENLYGALALRARGRAANKSILHSANAKRDACCGDYAMDRTERWRMVEFFHVVSSGFLRSVWA
jgi:hypothetical protein